MNKVAIVTGATRGIGKEAALILAKNGYRLTLVARDQTALSEVSEAMERISIYSPLLCAGDLAHPDFVREITEKTATTFGRIDVLVNNAAWRTLETMRTITLDNWERTLRVCITAPAFLAKYCAALMEEKQVKGVIINISSIMSEVSAGTSPAYIAAKGAMNGLTRELAITYGRSGIRVITVKPGYIDTDMSADYKTSKGIDVSTNIINEIKGKLPLERPGTANDIANAIYWLTTDQASYITGSELIIDGGLTSNFSDYETKKLQFPNQF